MRSGVEPEKIILAVVRAIEARFNGGDWLKFGYATGHADRVRDHPRLLRSLDYNDLDYSEHVLEMVESILRPRRDRHLRGGYAIEESKIDPQAVTVAERVLDLPTWLIQNEPDLYQELYGAHHAEAAVDDLGSPAETLGIGDVHRHATRIRQGLRDDPALAIGAAKELLESVLKAVLSLHGNGAETKQDLPQLVKRAAVSLGLDAGGVRDDEPGAAPRRKMLQSLTQLVIGAGELRNAGLGTGHGLSQGPAPDVATARLVVSAAAAAATFYMEAYEAQQPN
ncbi:abortive infection family protein [Streptomyces goshikiensis]|uniref:abortive infection family protein n=1 Tax=Streptomyces goshikiensis TaxID=1942 RepID=UPI0036AC3A61